MSWKPEVLVDGKWVPNGMAFATSDEARRWALDLLVRWPLPTDSQAVPSEQKPNYAYSLDGELLRLPDANPARQMPGVPT